MLCIVGNTVTAFCLGLLCSQLPAKVWSMIMKINMQYLQHRIYIAIIKLRFPKGFYWNLEIQYNMLNHHDIVNVNVGWNYRWCVDVKTLKTAHLNIYPGCATYHMMTSCYCYENGKSKKKTSQKCCQFNWTPFPKVSWSMH